MSGEYNQAHLPQWIIFVAMCFCYSNFLSEIGSRLMLVLFFLLCVQILQHLPAQLSASLDSLKTLTVISWQSIQPASNSRFIIWVIPELDDIWALEFSKKNNLLFYCFLLHIHQ